MNLFVKKPISLILEESRESGQDAPKRHLTGFNLILLGIGAIIGAGLFVKTAQAAAFHAGPGVMLSFVIAATGCGLAGLCYAEFAAMIPVAGSAYTYSYATWGQFIAWIIGWDLVLEYALGAATVSIAWSEYLNKLLSQLFGPDWQIPFAWSHSPFETSMTGESGIINLPAVLILSLLTLVLIRGIRQSAMLNGLIVLVKLLVVLLFIILGWSYIRPENLVPIIPEIDNSGSLPDFGGWSGIMAGAGIVFFAFIGFDAVSTLAQETKKPERDMPIGIIGSLAICTILYVLFAYVLTGVAPYTDFRTEGNEASVVYVILKYMPGYQWLALFVTVAILFGLSSVVLVMLLGQSRVFLAMSRDGLAPKIFSDMHPRFRTPWRSNGLFLLFTALFAAFIPDETVGNMTNSGALFAFILVCIGIIVMRRKSPDTPRPFKTPFVPFVPILGAIFCFAMLLSLGQANWIRLVIWQGIGLLIYFGYARKRAKIQA